jgi:hypothetical protein
VIAGANVVYFREEQKGKEEYTCVLIEGLEFFSSTFLSDDFVLLIKSVSRQTRCRKKVLHFEEIGE